MATVKPASSALRVRPPSSTAFQCETPLLMNRLPMLAYVCGRRGLGKGVATTNLIENLNVIDRIFYAGPAADSNSELLKQLGEKVAEEDVFSNLDDKSLLSTIVERVEAERDDLVRYREELEQYEAAMEKVHSQTPLFAIPDEELMRFDKGPPKHRWHGKAPCLLLWLDDILASSLTTGRGAKELASLCFRHRHVGAFKDNTPSLGLSIIINGQAFRTVGGVPKAVRANLTLLLLFRTRSGDELKTVAQEVAHFVPEEAFYKVCEAAWQERHDFLWCDFEPKKDHPTPFRRNFDEWIHPPQRLAMEPAPR